MQSKNYTEVKVGSAVVKIYLTPTGKYKAWTVVHFLGGKRKREKFSNEGDARSRATEIATGLDNGSASASVISRAEAECYVRACQLVEATGKSLELVASEYAENYKLTNGASLQSQGSLWNKHKPHSDSPLIPDLVVEVVKSLKQDGKSKRHRESIHSRLTTFAEKFTCQIGNISGVEIDNWLRDEQVKNKWVGRTRNHYRAAISNLISYAKRKKYLPHDWFEFLSVTKAIEEDGEVIIFTPEEFETILSKAPENIIPYLALAGFAGARQSEVLRSDWKDIHFEAKEFYVKGKVRTAGHRTAPLTDNCIEWLKPHVKKSGPLCPRRIAKILEKLPGWKINAPRRSFISYRLASIKNLNQVSEETGTSVATLKARYRRPVPREQAENWFKIVPKVSQQVFKGDKKPSSKVKETLDTVDGANGRD